MTAPGWSSSAGTRSGRPSRKMKRARSGALFLLLTPDQLQARIATLVPPPRTHALRYHGLFAQLEGPIEVGLV